jgi:hypothetical protein
MPYARIPDKAVKRCKTALETLPQQRSLRDTVESLMPLIEQRHCDGIPLAHIYKLLAEDLDVHPGTICKWYRKLVKAREKKRVAA